ncbi:MAG TPA: peptidoglycan-binding protein [Solirubrobacteraceae bacterium]|nr:peptidoglycan-binding protein [Solirubrobacteraceae bacterium]
MALKCPRFAGDPVLERCLVGQHRMHAPEDGLAVKRVQAALIALGRSVGAAGADGIFGPNTGAAVSQYKIAKGLSPSDPVVGAGTMAALDADLFFDPPTLDPAFGEFSPAVVARTLEPFVALELAALISAPLNTWRHMLGRFARNALNSGLLLGIVARSRVNDLHPLYLAVADPTQDAGRTAPQHFDDQLALPPNNRAPLGQMIPYLATTGNMQGFIVLRDDVVLGRAFTVRRSTGQRSAETVRSVVAHELTHLRNIDNSRQLQATPDTDATVYASTALAQQFSSAGRTVDVLTTFVEEICARHVEWNIVKEAEGNALAITTLTGEQLVQAAIFYFIEEAFLFFDNGYMAAINAQGDQLRFRQLELWLRICANRSFSDDASEEARTRALFRAAADSCAAQLVNPASEFPEALGLSPLPQDFR